MTTVLEPGDHPFCTRRSVVSYDTVRVMEVDLLIRLEEKTRNMREPLFIGHQRCTVDLLRRILQGALNSDMIEPGMKRELIARLTA